MLDEDVFIPVEGEEGLWLIPDSGEPIPPEQERELLETAHYLNRRHDGVSTIYL